jgi:hypothetical protein
LGSSDLGTTVRLAVIASNPYGSSTAASPATAIVSSGPAPTAPAQVSASFTGTLNSRQSSATFPLTVGSGVAQSSLAFSKWPWLTLTVVAADRTIVASANGASVLLLVQSLVAGSYTFKVAGTGKGGSSFTLTINYPSP